jgi:hypothetical protein
MPTLDEILKAAAKLDGKGGTRELKVTVEPASFVSKGKGRYAEGDIVRQCRVGRLNVSAYAVEAILRELHVWDKVPAERLAALFAMPDGD